MRKKVRIKALFMAMALMVATVCSSMSVLAAENDLAGLTVDGSVLTTDQSAEDSYISYARGNILSNGDIKLQNMGGRKLGLSGNTICHVTCDQVICNLYLQQYNASTGLWQSYDSWNASTTNAYSLFKVYETKVAGGYWYRLRGGHIAIKGGTVESITTTTDGIWVD